MASTDEEERIARVTSALAALGYDVAMKIVTESTHTAELALAHWFGDGQHTPEKFLVAGSEIFFAEIGEQKAKAFSAAEECGRGRVEGQSPVAHGPEHEDRGEGLRNGHDPVPLSRAHGADAVGVRLTCPRDAVPPHGHAEGGHIRLCCPPAVQRSL